MSILIFGDSIITHGAFDFKKDGWENKLTTFLWKRNFQKQEIAITKILIVMFLF